MYAVLGKLIYESNNITYYYNEVMYYSYTLLHQQSNFLIITIVFKSNNLVTSY